MTNEKNSQKAFTFSNSPKLFRCLLCQLLPEDDLLEDKQEEDSSIFLLISPYPLGTCVVSHASGLWVLTPLFSVL